MKFDKDPADENSGQEGNDIDDLVDERVVQNSDGTFSCGVCGKNMALRRHIRNHVEIHLNKKQTCDICNKQYKTRNSLGVHRNTIHKDMIPRRDYNKH